jgi:hypothetical protein
MAWKRNAVLLALIAGAAGAHYAERFRPKHELLSPLRRGAGALRLSRTLAVADPLLPDRPAFSLEAADPAFAGTSAPAGVSRDWVRARPDPALRHERTPQERGGIDPCALPPAKQSRYGGWKSVSAHSFIAFPEQKALHDDGSFDTMLLFHGHDVALTELAPVDARIVLFGTTLRDYRESFAGPRALGQLISAVEESVSREAKRPAHARRVALAAWSGGYDAISVLMEQSEDRSRVDAIVLLDGLHCSRDPETMPVALRPFVEFGKRAQKGQSFMFVSHSSVETDTYASTTETMHFLVSALGGKPLRVEREDPLGLRLVEMFDSGDFHERGYAGGGKRDHCAQLGLYPEALRALARRFR